MDIFDLELELKLANDKVMQGVFTMADIYLDSLIPRVKAKFEESGITPKTREQRILSAEDIKIGIKEARESRKQYIEEEKKKKEKEEQAKQQIRKYIENALEKGYKVEKIKRELLASKWPKNIVENTINEVTKTIKEKKTTKEIKPKSPEQEIEEKYKELKNSISGLKKKGEDTLLLETEISALSYNIKEIKLTKDIKKIKEVKDKLIKIEKEVKKLGKS